MILWPVILLITGGLALTQKHILFRQKRPGKDEQPFYLIKFSTLYDLPHGVEETGKDLEQRLTPLGKYLRKYSLDELPQLWNVIKGEMSLVGPRPLLMEYLPLYSKTDRIRHHVKPGITGWAQIHGRNTLSFKERFALDIWYVEHKSFVLDLQIMWKTIIKVIQKEGVYQEKGVSSVKFNGKN